MDRPKLDINISLKDFSEYYWLKEELTNFCKETGISTKGGKIDITNRIRHYLLTGKKLHHNKKTDNVISSFDWKTSHLNHNTIITDNYKNGENVRRFFTREIGKHFKFNVIFMKWVKQNVGKTLGDAITEWHRIHVLKKDKSFISEIEPQYEYNRYMRAFLADNPGLSGKDAMKYWKIKRTQRGTTEYDRTDLELKINQNS